MSISTSSTFESPTKTTGLDHAPLEKSLGLECMNGRARDTVGE